MRLRPRVLVAVAAAALLCRTPLPASAATSELDPSWAQGGKHFGKGSVQIVDSHGRALLAHTLADGALGVQRLSPTGVPDLGFGTHGLATVPVRSFVSPPGEPSPYSDFTSLVAAGIAELPDGRLLVLATSGNVEGYEVVRLRADGTIDPTFVGDGDNPVGEWLDLGRGAALLANPDGSFLVGVDDFPSDAHWLRRFTADGRRVAGAAGVVPLPYRPLCSYDGTLPHCSDGESADVNQLFRRPDGKIVVLMSNASMMTGTFVVQLRPSGTLDPAFGVEGVAELPFDHAWSGALAPGGDLFVSGVPRSRPAGVPQAPVRVADLTGTGRLRASFGDHGIATAWNGAYSVGRNAGSRGGGLALDASGRIVVAGTGYSSTNPSAHYCSVTRFTALGRVDTSFSTDSDGTATDGRTDSTDCRTIAVDAGGGYLVSATGGSRPTSLVERFRP